MEKEGLANKWHLDSWPSLRKIGGVKCPIHTTQKSKCGVSLRPECEGNSFKKKIKKYFYDFKPLRRVSYTGIQITNFKCMLINFVTLKLECFKIYNKNENTSCKLTIDIWKARANKGLVSRIWGEFLPVGKRKVIEWKMSKGYELTIHKEESWICSKCVNRCLCLVVLRKMQQKP